MCGNHHHPSTFSAACPGCGRAFLPAVFARLASLARSAATGSRRASVGLLTVLATALALAAPALAQGGADEEACPGGVDPPVPVEVAVTAVPIVVDSTTAEYFVLYAKHDVDGTEVEFPVLVKLGEAGTTTLSENVAALPAERYRVEKFLVADPADVDGDCIDDITELADPVGRNPVNPATAVELSNGAVAVPNRETFETLSFGKYHLKFILFGMDTNSPRIYFINTKMNQSHIDFLRAAGLDLSLSGLISGDIFYNSWLVAPDGSPGVYRYLFKYSQPFSLAARTYTVLAASMPLLKDNLAFHIPRYVLLQVQPELPLYRASRINLVFDEDVWSDKDFLVLNPGEGYGRLQVLDPDDRPHPRDVVLYEVLPNELPRVAGIISTVPQTPLSHVNLRAVQDGIPNAYIRDVLDDPDTTPLIGGFVRYEVTEEGWELSAATPEEVEAHYESSRPTHTQTPQRALSVTGITSLSQIGFEDWKAFGVKAANVAVLGTLGFPAGTVPDGFAIPFYFYDEFMKAHGFYDDVKEMLADEDFQTDFETQDDMLDDLRDDIKDAETPQWIIDALTAMHATFPEGTSLRYRSSTNNEDLPGFNGAGGGGFGGGGGGGSRTTPPSAPRNLTAVVGDGQVVLSWDAPESDGGAEITDYEYRINGRNPWISTGSTNTTHTVTGLVNGTEYTFQVRAVNRVGKSFAPNQVETTPEAPEAFTLDFTHFANGDGTTSDLVFVNVATHPIRPAIYFYDTEGALVSAESVVSLTGDLEITEDGGLTVRTEMEPLGELTISTHGQGELVSGSVRVASYGPIGGMLRFDLPAIGEAVVGASQPVSDALFPVRRQEGGITTGVAIHNLNEEAIGVSCRLMSGGAVLEEVEIPLQANGQTSWLIDAAFPGVDTSDFVGSVRCDADGEGLFSALALEMDPGARVFLILPVFPVNRLAGGRAAVLDFAHFANGDGTTSDLVFVNVSTQRSRPAPTPFHSDIPPIRPAIYFYDTEGNPIAAESVVEVTGDLEVTEDGGLTVRTEMEPLGELTISTHGQGELVSGSVEVVSEGLIGGMLRYNLPHIGEAVVGASPPISDTLFPVRRQEGGITTGVAIHNLESSPRLVHCDLMREGVLRDAASFPLEANGQSSWLIDQAFPGTDTSDFVGSVRCDAVGEGLFSAVALEMDPGTRVFTTLPVFPVPEMPDRE